MIDTEDLTAAGLSIAENLIKGQSDPQLSYMWEVGIEGAHRGYDYHDNAQLYATQCNIPQRGVEVIERSYMGEPIVHTANKSQTNTFRCTFWDDRSLVGFRYFHNWLNMVSDPQFGRKAKNEFIKRKVTLLLKDRTDLFKGAKIDFNNAVVTEIGEVQLSYDESAPMQFEVTFRFQTMLINNSTYNVSNDNNVFLPDTGFGGIEGNSNSGIGGFF